MNHVSISSLKKDSWLYGGCQRGDQTLEIGDSIHMHILIGLEAARGNPMQITTDNAHPSIKEAR